MQTLIARQPAESKHGLCWSGRRPIEILRNIHSIFDASNVLLDLAKQRAISTTHSDHAIIPKQGSTSDDGEVKSLKPCRVRGVEKSTVCRNNKLPAMPWLGPSQIIKEKIDCVNMNDIRIIDEFYNGRCEWIALRAKIRNANDFSPGDGIAHRENPVCVE